MGRAKNSNMNAITVGTTTHHRGQVAPVKGPINPNIPHMDSYFHVERHDIPVGGGEVLVNITMDDGEIIPTTIKYHEKAGNGPAPAHYTKTGRVIHARSVKEIEETVARWRTQGPQRLAHDLETAASATVPNGSGLHPHLGIFRLAQFGVADGGRGYAEALVIDTWKLNPKAAIELLYDEEYEKIIHYAQMEVKWVGYRYGTKIHNLIDTCRASKLIFNRHGFIGNPQEEDFLRLARDERKILDAYHKIYVQSITPEGETLKEDEIPAPDYAWLAQERTKNELAYEYFEQNGKPFKEPARRGVRHALGLVSQRDIDFELDKTQQMSYWDAVRLTQAQVQYAGEDVLSLLDLAKHQDGLLEKEDYEAIALFVQGLNDRAVGITSKEAEERNRKYFGNEEYEKYLHELEHPPAPVFTDKGKEIKHIPISKSKEFTKPVTITPKGCESDRAKEMISACRTNAELDRFTRAYSHMRIHFLNRDNVDNAIKARRFALSDGVRLPNTKKVVVPGWKQPF